MKTYPKDPDAKLDFGFDWSEWLDRGETINTSDWSVPEGITEVSDSKTDTVTTVWLSGGVEGQEYTITNSIITTGSREDDRSFKVKIINR